MWTDAVKFLPKNIVDYFLKELLMYDIVYIWPEKLLFDLQMSIARYSKMIDF